MSKDEDFYQTLRLRMLRWAEGHGASHRWIDYLMWAPDLFHLLWRLSLDPEVPARIKGKLLAAMVYFISPWDLIPEAVFGPAAYADDVALAAYVLGSVLEEVGPEVLRRHWAGSQDVLQVIRAVLKVAQKMVGAGIWSRLRQRL
jgi:uncharacterized membrane protein YkvA (DUF1232 family)